MGSRDFEHFLVGHWLWGAITYLAGRIAGEVAVFDSQGPAVPDRAAVLQEICTQQLVQNGKQGYSKSARQLSRSCATRRLT
jgi:hypothetical protein